MLPDTYIFSDKIMTYLKKLIGTESLNIKQCPAKLSPRIYPIITPKHLWGTLRMRKNPTQQPKIYSFLPPEKFPLINLLLNLSVVISFLSNSNFHQLPYIIFICCLDVVVVSLFIILLYHFCVMLILINRCLLNGVFSKTKISNGQSSLKQNFYSPHRSMLLKKLCLSLCLFLSFSYRFFYFKLYINFQLILLQLGLRSLSTNQI